MGTAKSVRFRMIESQSGYMSSSSEQAQSKITTAMIFDYDAIVKNYGIDIDVRQGYDEESPEVNTEAVPYTPPLPMSDMPDEK